MNANDLALILAAHKSWYSGESGGKRADLRGADLYGADLRGADLYGADLRAADLRGADLRGADLRAAYLRGAYLHGADLRGAYLHGAYLHGADLHGAENWGQSHDVIAELLRREAGSDWEKRSLAGLILVSRGWCWTYFLRIPHPQREWALSYLASLGCNEAKGGIS